MACRRTVARLWGGRCARCAKTHWRGGSCHECLAWASSIDRGLCRACREFARHNTPGCCRCCGRQRVVNRWRRCRLCATARREAHLAGDPQRTAEAGAGIQLFLGDLYDPHRSRPATPRPAERGGEGGAAGIPPQCAQQLRLLAVPADPHRLATSTPQRVAAELPGGLAAAIGACAEARGWTPATTQRVRQALAVLAAFGSLQLTEAAADLLRRHGLPVSRTRELLLASGFTEPAEEDIDSLVGHRTRHLPAPMREEVAAWVEVLTGQWGRSQPRSPTTIRSYLNAALPALTAWSGQFASLRQVTSEDVTAQLTALQGSQRTLTAVALRSLFAALKARRMVFSDPARLVQPGGFPTSAVLGLDADTRSSLLARLERADHRLVVLLAGVHALTRAQMIALRLDDVDLDSGVICLANRRLRLDPLVARHVRDWLQARRRRWPASANPHLLVSSKSAYGLGPVSTAYITRIFTDLPTTAAGLRADRLLAEAHATGDPLRLARLFALSDDTAVRYCALADPTLPAPHRQE